MSRFVSLLLALLVVAASGFAPSSRQTFRPANFVHAARPSTNKLVRQLAGLQMSSEGGNEDTQVSVESKISADGTFYDDEVGNTCGTWVFCRTQSCGLSFCCMLVVSLDCNIFLLDSIRSIRLPKRKVFRIPCELV